MESIRWPSRLRPAPCWDDVSGQPMQEEGALGVGACPVDDLEKKTAWRVRQPGANFLRLSRGRGPQQVIELSKTYLEIRPEEAPHVFDISEDLLLPA